jgi:UDP-MurNAc hydroxylase
VYLKPGEYFNKDLNKPINAPSEEEFESYRHLIENPWAKYNHKFEKQSLLNELQLRFDKIKHLNFSDVPQIIFKWGENNDQKIVIDLNEKNFSDNENEKNPYIKLIASEEYFALMHSGYRWQDIYLSLRAKVVRRPDTFNNIANIFIFSDVGNITNSMESTVDISNERFKREINPGITVTHDRFCPHQGADLCDAKIDENFILKCPRHGWEFDLSKNGVNKESKETINAEIIIKS